MVSIGMGFEVETAGVGVLAPIGTMPISSGRKEGEAGGRVESEDSDCAVICASAGVADKRANNKRAPTKGGHFWKSEIRAFRSAKQVRLQLRNCKQR